MKTNRSIAWFLSLCLMLLVAAPLTGQEDKPKSDKSKTEKSDSKEKSDKDEDSDEEDEDKDKEDEPVLAIVGGDIHTVSGPMIRQGTFLVKDGKILDVGHSIKVPDDATVIDAAGKTISPGFVAISMRGVGLRSTPSQREKLADALDPFDRNIKFSLGVGITTGCIEMTTGGGFGRRRAEEDGSPEEIFLGLEDPIEEQLTESMLDFGDEDTALCPCCGLPVIPTEPITPAPPTRAQPRKMAVLKMSFGNLDDMLTKETAFYSPSPGALNGALQRHNWRVEMEKAKKAIKEEKEAKEKTAKKSTTKKTDKNAKPDAKTKAKPKTTRTRTARTRTRPELKQLLNREIAMRIRANTVDEIRDMVELAQEIGYDIIIEGGIEAWVIGQELGASDVSVIYTPRQRRSPQPGLEDSTGSYVESPRIFQEAGVPFAVAAMGNSISLGGLAGRDLTSLPLEAAFAVRGGASEQAALEALTLTPARMMGLEDRIGSIEKGKDADILILNGNPLDYRTYVEQAIVAGKVSYERNVDRVYPVEE